MSCTSQKVRPGITGTSRTNSIQASNWNKFFPAKIETWNKSVLFTKRLVTLAVSNVTYLRSLFPEEAYCTRNLDGMQLKVLIEDNQFKPAATVASWLVAAFEALEKKYLRELSLVIYYDPSDLKKVHEMYTFKFVYSEGQVSCTMMEGQGNENASRKVDSDSICRSTKEMLRTILVATQSLDILPVNPYIVVKLMYYDDVTPVDFEPNGFVAADCQEMVLPESAFNVGVGNVSTNHLNVSLNVGSVQDFMVTHSTEADLASIEQASVHDSNSKETESVPDDQVSEQGSEASSLVVCPCGTDTFDELMLTCKFCLKLQHAACYRVVNSEDVPVEHCCISCYLQDPSKRICTDKKMVKMSSRPSFGSTCIVRRFLVFLMANNSFTLDSAAENLGVDVSTFEGLSKKLVSENIVREGSNGYEVVRKVLEDMALPKYLGTKKRTIDDVDKVVEEKEGSNLGNARRDGVKRKAESVNRQQKKSKVSASVISLVV